VGVALEAEAGVEDFLLVRFSIAVGVGVAADVVDVVRHHGAAVGLRVQTDRDVEPFSEGRDLGGVTVFAQLDHLQRVFAGCARLGGEGIQMGVAHPQPPARIERQVHRLADVRVGRDQLNLKALGKMEDFLFIRR
jgi:hypothetical protein